MFSKKPRALFKDLTSPLLSTLPNQKSWLEWFVCYDPVAQMDRAAVS